MQFLSASDCGCSITWHPGGIFLLALQLLRQHIENLQRNETTRLQTNFKTNYFALTLQKGFIKARGPSLHAC
jgi:hypothetical protein